MTIPPDFETQLLAYVRTIDLKQLASALEAMRIYWKHDANYFNHCPKKWNSGEWLYHVGSSRNISKYTEEKCTFGNVAALKLAELFLEHAEDILRSRSDYLDLCSDFENQNTSKHPILFATSYMYSSFFLKRQLILKEQFEIYDNFLFLCDRELEAAYQYCEKPKMIRKYTRIDSESDDNTQLALNII
tara:strand:- start:26233 stop:26796 length:564 start_codon:yes stop_codon:yes gene_type:complete